VHGWTFQARLRWLLRRDALAPDGMHSFFAMKAASDAVRLLQALALKWCHHGDPFRPMTWFFVVRLLSLGALLFHPRLIFIASGRLSEPVGSMNFCACVAGSSLFRLRRLLCGLIAGGRARLSPLRCDALTSGSQFFPAMIAALDATLWLQALALDGDPIRDYDVFLCGLALVGGDTAVSSAVSIHPHPAGSQNLLIYDYFEPG
jgi:hypothetical protein